MDIFAKHWLVLFLCTLLLIGVTWFILSWRTGENKEPFRVMGPPPTTSSSSSNNAIEGALYAEIMETRDIFIKIPSRYCLGFRKSEYLAEERLLNAPCYSLHFHEFSLNGVMSRVVLELGKFAPVVGPVYILLGNDNSYQDISVHVYFIMYDKNGKRLPNFESIGKSSSWMQNLMDVYSLQDEKCNAKCLNNTSRVSQRPAVPYSPNGIGGRPPVPNLSTGVQPEPEEDSEGQEDGQDQIAVPGGAQVSGPPVSISIYIECGCIAENYPSLGSNIPCRETKPDTPQAPRMYLFTLYQLNPNTSSLNLRSFFDSTVPSTLSKHILPSGGILLPDAGWKCIRMDSSSNAIVKAVQLSSTNGINKAGYPGRGGYLDYEFRNMIDGYTPLEICTKNLEGKLGDGIDGPKVYPIPCKPGEEKDPNNVCSKAIQAFGQTNKLLSPNRQYEAKVLRDGRFVVVHRGSRQITWSLEKSVPGSGISIDIKTGDILFVNRDGGVIDKIPIVPGTNLPVCMVLTDSGAIQIMDSMNQPISWGSLNVTNIEGPSANIHTTVGIDGTEIYTKERMLEIEKERQSAMLINVMMKEKEYERIRTEAQRNVHLSSLMSETIGPGSDGICE